MRRCCIYNVSVRCGLQCLWSCLSQGVDTLLKDVPGMHSERMVTALTFSLARAVCERAPRLLRDLCNTMMQYTFTNTPSWLVSFTPKCNLHPKVTVACFLFSSMINVYLFLSRRKKYMIVVFGSFLSVLSVNQFGMFWICCVNKHKNAWTLTSPTKGIVIYNTLYPQVCFFFGVFWHMELSHWGISGCALYMGWDGKLCQSR